MPRAIWKYPLQTVDTQTIDMPAGRVLAVAEQNYALQLWAEVTPGAPLEPVRVYIIGTGHPFNGWEVGRYVGTVQQANGALVWHVYVEDGEPA